MGSMWNFIGSFSLFLLKKRATGGFFYPKNKQPLRDGFTLVEMMVSLVVLGLGLGASVITVCQAMDGVARARHKQQALHEARLQIEQLRILDWSDPGLAVGKHSLARGRRSDSDRTDHNSGNRVNHNPEFSRPESSPWGRTGEFQGHVQIFDRGVRGQRDVQVLINYRALSRNSMGSIELNTIISEALHR